MADKVVGNAYAGPAVEALEPIEVRLGKMSDDAQSAGLTVGEAKLLIAAIKALQEHTLCAAQVRTYISLG